MKLLKSILPVFLLCFSFQIKAQGPTMGFQSGALYSVNSYDGESMSGFGYYFGVSGIISISERWSVRPEVNFQQRRVTMKYTDSYTGPNYAYEETESYRLNYHFLDLPVLVQFQANNNFGFYFGPQYGTLIGAKYTLEYAYEEKELSTGETYKEEGSYSETGDAGDQKELSLIAGMNYTLDFGLAIDFRAQRSLIASDYGDFDAAYSWANFQLGLRYNLPIGKK